MSYSSITQELYELINKVRRDPKFLIPILKNYCSLFEGTLLKLSKTMQIETNEGSYAVEECIEFLETLDTLSEVIIDPDISKLAQDYIIDDYLHDDDDDMFDSKENSKQTRIIDEHKNLLKTLVFGKTSAFDIFYEIIIDDGNFSRMNRKNMFNPQVTKLGIACGPGGNRKNTCIILLHKESRELSEKIISKSLNTPLNKVNRLREKKSLDEVIPSPPKVMNSSMFDGKRRFVLKINNQKASLNPTFIPQKLLFNRISNISKDLIKVPNREYSPTKIMKKELNDSLNSSKILNENTDYPLNIPILSSSSAFKRKFAKVGIM